jgi:general secretion pathway protein F
LGEVQTGEIDSPSESASYETLRGLGITVVELHEGGHLPNVPWYRREVALFGGGMSLADQAALAEQMATMFRVHLPVLQIMRIISEGATHSDTSIRLGRVARLVAEGMPLAKAFAQVGPKVKPLFLTLLKTAEQSDSLPEQLSELARLLRQQDQMRGQVATALVYPSILICAAMGVVLIVSLTLAPALAPLFEEQGREMPRALSVFLWLGQVLERSWLVILGLMIPLLFIVVVGLRAALRRLTFRLPLFGPLAMDAALLAMVRSLALMLRAGQPLTEALRTVADADRANPFAPEMAAAAQSLERGGRAHDALAANGRLPVMARELFRVGEEANALVPVLEALAASLSGNMEQGTQRALRLLTPILTLILGGLIGGLVYSIMGAVLSINEVVF